MSRRLHVIRIFVHGGGEKFVIYRPADRRTSMATAFRRIQDQLDTPPTAAGEMEAWLDEQPGARRDYVDNRCYLVDVETAALFKLWFG